MISLNTKGRANDLLGLELYESDLSIEDAEAFKNASEIASNMDNKKATLLYGPINAISGETELKSKLGKLAYVIEPAFLEWIDDQPVFHRSLASSAYLNHEAYQIGLAARALVGKNQVEFSVVSICPYEWWFSPEELEDLSLDEFMEEIADTFAYLGINSDCGCLMAFIHGYFDPLSEVFKLSLFGLADKRMVEAIGRLRGFPRFKDRDGKGDCITIQPLANYSLPLTSLVQINWLVKISYEEAGKQRLVELDGEIDHPYLAPSLLWRDRWDLASATLTIGLYTYDSCLRRSKRQ
jgi:hypothetical protein